MLNMKKTAVAVLAFASSTAFAGTMGPVCTPGNVTVPCESTGWAVGAKALYLQPTVNSSVPFLASTVVESSGVRTADFDPEWRWGFQVEAAYHFSTGNDLNLNWYHLGSKTNTTSFSPAISTGVGVGGLSVSSVRLEPKWDAVNLEFGQHVDFGEFKNIRFHGGVQYARMENDARFVGTLGGLASTASVDNKYTGFGPRTGADMSYDLGNGLGIYANAAAAILAGKTKANVVNTTGGTTTTFSTQTAKRSVLVPEVEAKLGMMYNYAMAQGDLTFDVGYMWVNYFNVHQLVLAGNGESNFGLQGPYAGLKWVGNMM